MELIYQDHHFLRPPLAWLVCVTNINNRTMAYRPLVWNSGGCAEATPQFYFIPF